ncbi:hypothetical protein KC19_2G127700 [Ceratodon purpureus]|uniref:Uncharacterized protein n=1 Tax=Ceratodon purpureus TaxID=3225 RepID=A0A8T0IUV5_CERPU|nr:hypothetical protein KC19_2G127700 [Ceratodon purpureus]
MNPNDFSQESKRHEDNPQCGYGMGSKITNNPALQSSINPAETHHLDRMHLQETPFQTFEGRADVALVCVSGLLGYCTSTFPQSTQHLRPQFILEAGS